MAAQASLSLTWSKTPNTCFPMTRLKWIISYFLQYHTLSVVHKNLNRTFKNSARFKWNQNTSYKMFMFKRKLQLYRTFLKIKPWEQKNHFSHDMTKPTKWLCIQRRQISLGICPVWSESSLSAWRKLGSLATHWVHIEDSDQTGRMPRLIWVFAGHTLILLVFSWRGSFYSN